MAVGPNFTLGYNINHLYLSCTHHCDAVYKCIFDYLYNIIQCLKFFISRFVPLFYFNLWLL